MDMSSRPLLGYRTLANAPARSLCDDKLGHASVMVACMVNADLHFHLVSTISFRSLTFVDFILFFK